MCPSCISYTEHLSKSRESVFESFQEMLTSNNLQM